ncbi:hypothetical protein SAMN05443633_102466 [Chryseobacterium arachidis]|uniref:Uncharacterized protein n=2 Tax=Chryseobacterium arachidis TaxID=1416778 RepID=A0A1M4XZ00_9FLAO|nr:hypothetical protein [Chryseobacterium arachidis]SHE98834.1 hypothetical protein SAMN05443633_102466 [Chryseobacterium arachidis]
MKKLVVALFIFFSIHTFSQTASAAKEVFEKIKKESKIDGNDKTIYNILNEFYDKNLQAENDEMGPDTVEKIQKLASDSETKNLHILMLFLMYQQHISQTAMVGKKPNPEFQVATIKLLEEETKNVYGKIPAIIYIYQYEALDNSDKKAEAKAIAVQGLKEYPDSVPLKVYTYISTKDPSIKDDLVKNHSNHWMVKQFDIKNIKNP